MLLFASGRNEAHRAEIDDRFSIDRELQARHDQTQAAC